MVPEAVFIKKFNTQLQIKYENKTLVLKTCDRVAILSILIAHQTGLINYLCNELLFDGFRSHFLSAIKHPASKKKYENYTLVLIASYSF